MLGCDRAASLTDSILLVTAAPDCGELHVLQLPRDTYAAYTDRAYKKLNGAYAALGAGVRPNLLVNPFFKVNQRGQSTYNTDGYCLDNWKIYKSTGNYGVSVHEDYITISAGSDRETRVDQFFENPDDVLDKEVTGSVLLYDGTLVTGTAVFKKSDGSVYETETLYSGSDFALLIQSSPTGSALVRLVAKTGKSAGVKAVKLEFGDTQTLAYQDDSGAWQLLERPDPLEELKCQRFFQIFNPASYAGRATSANSLQAVVPIPAQMRTTPVLSDTNAANWRAQTASGEYVNLTGVKVYSSGINSGYITLFAESNGLFSAGNLYSLARLSSAGIWSLSAEL